MESEREDENKSTEDVQIPEFIKRMKENGSTVIFKGKDFACNNK